MSDIKEALHEIKIVSNMITEAQKHNLVTEVVLFYGYACRNNRPSGAEEYQACANEALEEWIK